MNLTWFVLLIVAGVLLVAGFVVGLVFFILFLVKVLTGAPVTPLDFAHILRAVMCLYLALGLFWLFSAFSDKYRNAAVLTTVIFAGGLVSGRIISLFADGQPSPILVVYIALELTLVPVAIWVFRLPE